MIRAIAIDDEPNALGVITEYTRKVQDLELVETFTNPLEVLNFMEKHADIDVIFLDIQMSKLNGLALARRLPKHCKIILTTAYPEHAFEGYEMDVVDYLLKPFPFERFYRAVEKAKVMLNYVQPILNLPEQQKPTLKPEVDEFIMVKTDYRIVKIELAQIQYLEGTGNYVTIHTTSGKILTIQTMRTFEEYLRPYQFARIHKSFIISLLHVHSIEKAAVVINKTELPIGEKYRESFNQFLQVNFKHF